MTVQLDSNVEKMHSWIDAHTDELVAALQGVLRIPSVEADPAGPEAPYGKHVRAALDYTLSLCEQMGFRVRDCDGYAGDAEFGSGDEYVGVLGHLDVVPEGDGWKDPPYSAVIHDGFIYARGSSDDKGPTYAALWAAKALMESDVQLKRRVRLIFGCNEESGFGCVHHYFEVRKEERPAVGFTPDAGFPLYYAEKGICNLLLEKAISAGDADLKVVSAKGGLRPNMVPDSAEAVLQGNETGIANALVELNKYWDKNITWKLEGSSIHIKALGKSAHGSTPREGDNAVERLFRCLRSLELPLDHEWLSQSFYSLETTGTVLGIAHTDDVAGPLTSNLGILDYDGNRVQLTFNVRYPVTWVIDDVKTALSTYLETSGWSLADVHNQASLYVPLDTEPARTLLRVYQEETGDTTTKPATTGGGTYARATPHMVAYGAGFPGGSDGPAHQVDERIAIDTLVRSAKIFAHALYELAK